MKKILIALLLVFITGTSLAYFWLHGITKKIFIPHENKVSASVTSIQQSLDNKNPINIVLLGYGGGKHDGAYFKNFIIANHIYSKGKKKFFIFIPPGILVKILNQCTDGS